MNTQTAMATCGVDTTGIIILSTTISAAVVGLILGTRRIIQSRREDGYADEGAMALVFGILFTLAVGIVASIPELRDFLNQF